MNILEFNKSLKIIESFIDSKISEVSYKVVGNAPEKYSDMVRLYNDTGYFHINGESSNLTIHTNPKYNIKFRAIHDKMHYDFKLDFKFNSEILLSKITECVLFAWAHDQGYAVHDIDNACKIVDAEINGQIKYYQENGDFVKNQREFVLNYLSIKAV